MKGINNLRKGTNAMNQKRLIEPGIYCGVIDFFEGFQSSKHVKLGNVEADVDWDHHTITLLDYTKTLVTKNFEIKGQSINFEPVRIA
jgi:hypothetical protein